MQNHFQQVLRQQRHLGNERQDAFARIQTALAQIKDGAATYHFGKAIVRLVAGRKGSGGMP